MKWEQIFCGTPALPEEILRSREARAFRQKAFLQQGCPCLISFTLNIPGAVKRFPLAQAAFQAGLCELQNIFSAEAELLFTSAEGTGPEAIFSCALSPLSAKKKTVLIEEFHPLGRLFDIDVLDQSGISVSRSMLGLPPRSCLLCSESGKLCRRRGGHSLSSLQEKVAILLDEFFKKEAASHCAELAVRALLYEVAVTPKPGLVDRQNSGAHTDMDFFTFMSSSAALGTYFQEVFFTGWDFGEDAPEALMERLRYIGQQAERRMMRATGGVNTHKGLIFSMGILCAAIGAVQSHTAKKPDTASILQVCQKMGRCTLSDFSDKDLQTAGSSCYRQFQISGARGEAAQGFPSAAEIGLPALRRWTARGLSINDSSVMTLLSLLAQVTDTNMIHRGGIQAAQEAKSHASALLRSVDANTLFSVSQLDQEFIRKNLSPGGCADLLALSLFLFFWEQES